MGVANTADLIRRAFLASIFGFDSSLADEPPREANSPSSKRRA
jgi:hypothetical protein